MRVEESVDIARPPEDVWAYVVDPANDPRWCRKVKSVRRVGDRRCTRQLRALKRLMERP
jgi:uncharacterized protein YndB with AHSA1/START domain